MLWQPERIYICLPIFDKEGAQLGCNGAEDNNFATRTVIKGQAAYSRVRPVDLAVKTDCYYIISFLTMEYRNQTLQYYLGARGILHSTLLREYTD